MTTSPVPELPPTYLNAGHTVRSWLLTRDHKRIGVLYLASVFAMFLLGGIAALFFRVELMTPGSTLISNETYNKLFTMHGVVMVFFFLLPSIPATIGNFFVPIMVGARDLAFPRINLLSWYLFIAGAGLALAALVLGGVDTGWTFYTPYSSTYANSQVILVALGIFVAGFSSILTGLNFIVTIHKMRAPGLTWFRMPLFIWAHYATSLIMILGTPVVAISIFLVALERIIGLGIFDPALGGDPVLFQHMFWFYSHPAVYIMILPGMGVISEIVACFCKKNVFGYHFVAYSSLAIAIIGFFVWGHHMFVSSQSVYVGMIFSILTYLVAIPSAVKVFNWTATLYQGTIEFSTPLLYALGFIGLFTIGGLTGLPLANLATDVHLHDTYYVVAHFHYVMVGGMVFSFLAGIHFYWPKMFGVMYNQILAKVTAVLIFTGFNATFFPQFLMGFAGHPRRYHDYPPEFQILHVMSTAGASLLAGGFGLFIGYMLWSLIKGKKAPEANHWGAKGLEWEIPSPPPPHNFLTRPVVTRETYDYHHPSDDGPDAGGGEEAPAHV